MSQSDLPFPFDARRSALLVVDMQNDFVRQGAPLEVPDARETLPRINDLIALWRHMERPVVFTRFVAGENPSLLWTWSPMIHPQAFHEGLKGIVVEDSVSSFALPPCRALKAIGMKFGATLDSEAVRGLAGAAGPAHRRVRFSRLSCRFWAPSQPSMRSPMGSSAPISIRRGWANILTIAAAGALPPMIAM